MLSLKISRFSLGYHPLLPKMLFFVLRYDVFPIDDQAGLILLDR